MGIGEKLQVLSLSAVSAMEPLCHQRTRKLSPVWYRNCPINRFRPAQEE
jgi:hypothetical protein